MSATKKSTLQGDVTVQGFLEVLGGIENPDYKRVKETVATTRAQLAITTADARGVILALADDGTLSTPEKKVLKREYEAIMGERSTIHENAEQSGIPEGSIYRQDFIDASTALDAYVAPLLADLTVDTTVVRTTFNAYFAGYYNARTTLIAATNGAINGMILARPTTNLLTTAPADVTALTALASERGLAITALAGGTSGIDNQTSYFRYRISRDGGATYTTDFKAAAKAEYIFDRDVDGYPEKTTLQTWRIQAKAVSPAGVESLAWKTVSLDVSAYGTYVPGTPGLSGSADNRTAELRLVVGGSYYGHSRFEVQIQRDGDGASWYAPGDSGAARSSETSYRGAVDGYATAYADTFAQTLPLINQSVGLPINTSYLYRIRAVVAKPTTAAPDAVARSAWTAAVTVVAKPTGTVDLSEKAIKTAQLDDSAVTIENLNVLAKNLVNDLTDDADGTTGWTLVGGSTVEVDATIGRRALNMPAVTHASYCAPFAVGPNDIIEVDVSFRAITASTNASLRHGIDGVALLQYATWDATAKAWGAFGGSVIFRDCVITATTGSYTAVKSYIVGQNVKPGDIPAPVNAAECVRVVSSPTIGIGLVVFGAASRVYAFAPSARKVGSGKIVAQQIVTPNLSAISAKLGEIEGDTADYKLVMGSGGSAEEGTLILGATTDASYFRRWKEGGVWKMAIKLATLFVDAVSSKILGIFRVRNSADTATVFEVDPVNGISSLINHKFPAGAEYNGGAKSHKYAIFSLTASTYKHIATLPASSVSTHDVVKISVVGGAWTQPKTGMDVYLTARNGVKGRYIGAANGCTVEVYDNGINYDVWLKVLTGYYTATAEVTINASPGIGLGSGVTSAAPSGTLVWSSGASADRVNLDLAAVTASSLAVSGNAQVGSLNGAAPGAGGLELLGLSEIGFGRAGITPKGSPLSIAPATDIAICALNSTDIAYMDDGAKALRTYRWNGSTWVQVGSALGIASINNPAICALNSTDIAYAEKLVSATRIYRMHWDGALWSSVGYSDFALVTSNISITALNSTDIAFADGSTDALRTYRWNGSTWVQVGSALGIASINNPAICALNSTDIALIDSLSNVLRTYRWNGSTWAQVGSYLGIASISKPSLTRLCATEVALVDAGTDLIRVYYWNGSVWSYTGASYSAGATNYPAITALTPVEIAIADSGVGTLRTYTIGTPTTPTVIEKSNYTIERTRLSVTIAFEAGCTQGTVYSVITYLLGTATGDIGCSGRYGIHDIGYILITSTTVKIISVYNDIMRIECTKNSAATITNRIILQFPV